MTYAVRGRSARKSSFQSDIMFPSRFNVFKCGNAGVGEGHSRQVILLVPISRCVSSGNTLSKVAIYASETQSTRQDPDAYFRHGDQGVVQAELSKPAGALVSYKVVFDIGEPVVTGASVTEVSAIERLGGPGSLQVKCLQPGNLYHYSHHGIPIRQQISG